MIKRSIYLLLFFISAAHVSYCQVSKKDSSSAEIKQQAIEMREKLNKYMAERLGTTNSSSGNSSLIDSIANMFAKQQMELKELKAKFELLETNLTQGKYPLNAGTKPDSVVKSKPNGKGFTRKYDQPSDKRLIVYFPFDVFDLTVEQIQVIKQFMAAQKDIQSVTLHGYSDWIGNENHNRQLKVDRCLSVKKHLPAKKTIRIFSHVKCNALLDTAPEDCRKVEIIVK